MLSTETRPAARVDLATVGAREQPIGVELHRVVADGAGVRSPGCIHPCPVHAAVGARRLTDRAGRGCGDLGDRAPVRSEVHGPTIRRDDERDRVPDRTAQPDARRHLNTGQALHLRERSVGST